MACMIFPARIALSLIDRRACRVVPRAPESRVGLVRLLTLVAMALSGCAPRDRSILPRESPHPNIQNGVAYDVGTLDLRGVRKIAVPSTTVVRRASSGNEGLTAMEKTLGVVGSPVKPIDIADRRKELGCAYKREGDSLVVGTYGEYVIPGHGGAFVRLAVYLPEGMTVDKRAELGGAGSLARNGDPAWHRLDCAGLDSTEASRVFPGEWLEGQASK